VTINGLVTQNIPLNLSSPTPAGGLTVNLTSSNPSVATVLASVTIAGGATSVNVPVTGIAPGNTTITAIAAAPRLNNASTNVTVATGGAITLPPNGAIGLGQTVPFPVTLSSPAPTDVTINLVSSDPNRVALSAPSVLISAGQAAPATQPTITGLNLG